jgi:Methyltransferase domain
MRLREFGIVLRNGILAGNIESLLAARDPRRAAYCHTEMRFLHRCLFPRKSDFPQKPVWEVFGVDQVPVVLYGNGAGAWVQPVASHLADLISMCMLCQITKPKVILEIGTFHGSGALHWAGNAPEAEVYTLDLPAGIVPSLAATEMDRTITSGHAAAKQMAFEGRPEAKRIHPLYGDSATFDFSPFIGKVDLLFIDGAHSYEYVRNDTLRAVPCCRPGSVIAWHDYGRAGFNGVSRWLHEYSRQGKQIYRVPGGSLAYARL